MNQIDFAAINMALSPASAVREWLPDGKKVGNEWVARNPNRHDAKAGSFSVNLNSGKWADFATGDKGGDLVSLYAFLFHANDNGRAARELADRHGVRFDAETRQAAATAEVTRIEGPEVLTPVPDSAPAPTFRHPKFGQPAARWQYLDAKGRTLLWVCRFDPAGMRKQVLPYSYCRHPDGTERWTWRGITGDAKRPLYGLDRLAANPGADVLLVEGEKTADAAQRLVGDRAVVLAWLGGVETAGKVSLRPLVGRRVILWPDADAHVYPEKHPQAGEVMPPHEQPGNRAMLAIADRLREVATSIAMVRYVVGASDAGWDLADAEAEGWDGDRVFAHIGTHAVDPREAVSPPREPDAAPTFVPVGEPLNPFGFPRITDKGQPLNVHANLAHLLREYGITCRYNVMRHSVDIEIPGREYSEDNRANCALAEINSLCALNRMPRESLMEYTRLIADEHAHHPVLDWIQSKPWDGRSRLPELYATIEGPGPQWLRELLIRRWLVSAVASLIVPRFRAHGVLVFQGDQGLGKTTWVRSLVPEAAGAVLEGAIIDPDNKDTVLTAISHWLVELGELDATFRKADVERLKAFVTKPDDKIRRPYDRVDSVFKRRTVFFASVNAERYLVDETGNRRWWTIPVSRVDYQHTIDTQQLWAEVLDLQRSGEQWWLSKDEEAALGESNQDHEAVDPMKELVLSRFQWGLAASHSASATDVLMSVGYDRPTKLQANAMSQVLTKLTGRPPRKSNGKRVFDLPPRMGTHSNDNDDKGRGPF